MMRLIEKPHEITFIESTMAHDRIIPQDRNHAMDFSHHRDYDFKVCKIVRPGMVGRKIR